MPDYAIILRKATKKYAQHTILSDIDAEFADNQIHGIIGHNGCGKTLLMKMICGFVIPTSGEIIVRNKPVRGGIIPPDIGIIIEAPGFLPYYSGKRNLQMLARMSGKADRNRISEVMSLVGLDVHSKKHVGKYSLGMRQRLGIAQAIMENPSIFLLDEPMNGLDKQGVKEIRKLLLSIKEQGATMLLASHNAEDIAVLCESIWEIEEGKIQRIK